MSFTIFSINSLKSFSWRLRISLSLTCYSRVYSFSLIWVMVFCLFIFIGFLCGDLFTDNRVVGSLTSGVCPPCGWSWYMVCCRLPDGSDRCLPTGRQSWFLSLWCVEFCLWVRLEKRFFSFVVCLTLKLFGLQLKWLLCSTQWWFPCWIPWSTAFRIKIWKTHSEN